MIDSEVMRLRRLRNTALKGRALAVILDEVSSAHDSVFSRSAQICWRIARVITGTLRSHPYISYQRGPRELRAAYNALRAVLVGTGARYQGRSLQIYLGELQRVARALDDARALTRSPDLSDTLGRSQAEVRGLLKELQMGARHEAGFDTATTLKVDARSGAIRDDARAVAGNWPYLAF